MAPALDTSDFDEKVALMVSRLRDLGVSYIEQVRDSLIPQDGQALRVAEDNQPLFTYSELSDSCACSQLNCDLAEEHLATIRAWSPPMPLLDWQGMLVRISRGIWHTGHSRYWSFHKELKRAAPSEPVFDIAAPKRRRGLNGGRN